MSTRDLVFDIFAIDRASAVFSRVGAEADAMGTKVSKGSKVAGDALLVAGSVAVGLGIKAVTMAAQFDSSITRLGTTAGESKAHLGEVSQGILDMAGKVGWSAQELATAMYHVESGGYHGAAALLVLKDAAQAARIEGSNVTDVAHALTGALNDYRGTTLTAAEATNAMTAAVGSGMMTFNDLAEAMPKIGARAAATHVTFEEMLAALGTMTKDGLPAANAATYLGQTIGQLAAPTARARTEMKGLGINSTEVAQTITSGSGHGLADAIEMLYKGIQNHLVGGGLISVDTFKKMSSSTTAYQQVLAKLPPALQTPIQALATMAGGVRSFQGILMLGGAHAQQYADTLHAVSAQVKKGGDSIAGFSDVQKTLAFQAEATKGKLSALGVEIGHDLTPIASDALGIFGGFVGFLASHQQVVIDFGEAAIIAGTALLAWKAAAIGVAAAEAIAAGATTGFGLSEAFLNVQLAATAFATEGAAAGFGFLGAAMDATPIGLIALGIGGAVAGIMALTGAFGHATDADAAFHAALKQVDDATGPSAAHISGLAGTYDTLRGSITKATYAMVEQDLVRSGALRAAQHLGISELTLASASLGNAASIRVVNRHLAEWKQRAVEAAAAAEVAKRAMQVSGGLVNGRPDPAGAAAAAKAAGDAAAQYAGLSQSIQLVQKAFGGETQSVKASVDVWKNSALAASDAAGAFDRVRNKAEFINAPLVHTQRQVAELAAVFHLSGAQIQTVMRDEMVKGTVDGVQKMTAAIVNAKGGIHAASVDLGLQLAAGARDGIDSAALTVAQAAANMVDQAINAARHRAKIQSPSKRAHDEIGLQIGLGVASGIDASQDAIQAAARRAANAAHRALMTGLHVSNVELSAQLSADNAQLTKVNQQIAAAEAWGKTFEGNVFSAALTLPSTSRQMMVNGTPVTIADSGQGITAKSSPAQVFAAMMSYQTAQAKQAATLAADVGHLRKEGISAAVLAQMQGAGANGLLEISALAHATRRQVAAFDRLVARTQASLDNTGALATSGKAMQTLQNEKNRDAREVANIKRALHGVKLTIANGGATLRPA